MLVEHSRLGWDRGTKILLVSYTNEAFGSQVLNLIIIPHDIFKFKLVFEM